MCSIIKQTSGKEIQVKNHSLLREHASSLSEFFFAAIPLSGLLPILWSAEEC